MQRIIEIDILRGIGIFSVVLIHSTVQYTSNSIAFFLWDANQFAVQALVFCSSYIYFLKEDKEKTLGFVNYFKKRVLRLLLPYYLFMALFFIILFIFEKQKLTPSFIKESILITGGIDLNWLVLLFIQLAVALPILTFLKDRFKPGFYVVGALCVLSSIALLFYNPDVNYKLIMWLPWLTIAFFAFFFVRFQKDVRFLIATYLVTFTLFVGLYLLQLNLGHSLKMFDNKYPPNIFYLMYGMMIISFILLLHNMNVFKFKFVERFLLFFSSNSFSLYFIHSIIIFFLLKLGMQKQLTWYIFFLVVLVISILLQYVINLVLRASFKKQ